MTNKIQAFLKQQEGKAQSDRQKILKCILDNSHPRNIWIDQCERKVVKGLTIVEVCQVLTMREKTVSGRISELLDEGFIKANSYVGSHKSHFEIVLDEIEQKRLAEKRFEAKRKAFWKRAIAQGFLSQEDADKLSGYDRVNGKTNFA